MSAPTPAARPVRVGLVVPSSNTTMETEVPALLRRVEAPLGVSFTFHGARMPMVRVNLAELQAMDANADAAARSLGDAGVDVLAYACLVAVLCNGAGYANTIEQRLERSAREAGATPQIVTSASALIAGIRALGARRIAMITPYLPPLTTAVVEALRASDIEVVDALSLGIASNREVGDRDPRAVLEWLGRLDHARADAIVLSACVQMPSLAAVEEAEQLTGKPVLTAAIATATAVLRALDLPTHIPGAGALARGEA